MNRSIEPTKLDLKTDLKHLYTPPVREVVIMEVPALEKLDRFLEEHGYTFRGKHHEIYLNDLRRVASNKMRTVIRHPFG